MEITKIIIIEKSIRSFKIILREALSKRRLPRLPARKITRPRYRFRDLLVFNYTNNPSIS